MTSETILAGILAKAKEAGLTNQQISDRSGVPKPTVDRILSGRTPNPTMQNVLDIAEAVGYDLSPAAVPVPEGTDGQYIAQIIAMYERQLTAQQMQYNLVTSEKNRWIKMLALIIGILVSCILFILIYDITHPEIGWFQR